jgi:hypothetical protein
MTVERWYATVAADVKGVADRMSIAGSTNPAPTASRRSNHPKRGG